VNPDAVRLPPYYPDDPVMRKDWAEYLDSVNYVDQDVGYILGRLEREGELDNTVVFFWTDHGIAHARGKQFLYEEGIRVPLIVRAPDRVEKGSIRRDLVAHIDIAATSLEFAGIPLPGHLESRPLFGPKAKPREYVVTARDRCDETVDRIRSVRTDRYKYIRNYYPDRPLLQPSSYKDGKEIVQRLRQLHEEGKLNEIQERVLFSPRRPREAMYDLQQDPWELNDLAGDTGHQKKLAELRGILEGWIKQSGDKGETPEREDAYDGEMQVYLAELGDARRKITLQNIETMKRWAREGK
jgi:arylsulfatase A-like enzyme